MVDKYLMFDVLENGHDVLEMSLNFVLLYKCMKHEIGFLMELFMLFCGTAVEDRGCSPTNVMVDLERTAMNAIWLIFSTAALSACCFHLSQCVWWKVQELGLHQEYTDNKETWITIKMLPALAFVPPGDVAATFEDIDAPDNLIPLLDYFEDSFVRHVRCGRCGRPLFPVELWNVRDRVCEGLPRSNNLMEGWHRVFNQSVSMAHPGIYALIKQFKKEQKHTNKSFGSNSGRQRCIS
nr:PREDICTED: uncharacterized protein LOC106702742 [Latimeria chalumnae]|eukprot:XP_014341335.1 PREDICTED: uncharacterized protein LOC106702742 [Latimeria chalumnae]